MKAGMRVGMRVGMKAEMPRARDGASGCYAIRA
jgi:hypothetical protein